MRESSWRDDAENHCDCCGELLNKDGSCPTLNPFGVAADDWDDEDDDDPLAPIPPQPGFDNELWHDREDDELGDVEEDE